MTSRLLINVFSFTFPFSIYACISSLLLNVCCLLYMNYFMYNNIICSPTVSMMYMDILFTTYSHSIKTMHPYSFNTSCKFKYIHLETNSQNQYWYFHNLAWLKVMHFCWYVLYLTFIPVFYNLFSWFIVYCKTDIVYFILMFLLYIFN